MAERASSSWPRMLWVGGTSGAGKSCLARRLAHRHDLPLMPVDAYRHRAGRDGVVDPVGLVVDEIRSRELGDVAVVVEGPQLEPDLATALPPGHAVWLVATPERIRRVLHERGPGDPSPKDEARLEAVVIEDTLLGERLRRRAMELGRPVVEVPVDVDWDAVAAAAGAALGPGLGQSHGIDAGRALAAARRWENDAAYRQLVSHDQAQGLVTSRRFPFACECGRSGCAAIWQGRPEEYAAASAAGSVTASGHR